MDLLTDVRFWAVVLAIYVALLVEMPIRRTAWFGLVNSLALFVLVGFHALAFVVLLGSALWYGLRSVHTLRANKRRLAARAAITLLVGLLAGLFLLRKLGSGHGLIVEHFQTMMPGVASLMLSALIAISFSYVILRAADLVRMVTLEGTPLLDPISLVGYLAPFHMLVAGPICSYKDHLAMNAAMPADPTFSRLLRAVSTITTGLFYKLVIAEGLRIFAFGVSGKVAVENWKGAGYALVYLFFDFAGYSLVALGIGRLCSIPTPRNFRAPFLAATVTDFWVRWHASLGSFVRRNIFTPLQLKLLRLTRGRAATALGVGALAVSFVFVGAWHRLSWRFVCWGLAMGLVMAAEKAVRDFCLRFPWARSRVAGITARTLGPLYVFAILTTSLLLIAREVL